MKIAIVHFHLNRGGVTRVIINHLLAIDKQLVDKGTRLSVALIYGGRAEDWPAKLSFQSLDVSLFPVKSLDYDNVRDKDADLTAQLQSTLQQVGFDPEETILHFHNHALGKNASLPQSIAALARANYPCLLQVHDFAEDFRPQQYQQLTSQSDTGCSEASATTYPQAPHIHYAVLNGRDHATLLDAGIVPARLHLLPNPVAEFGTLPEQPDVRARLERHSNIPVSDRLLLYPVRGIRRKNLGEALLWSALADKQTSFALTLAPLNPAEQPSYQRWKELAKRLKLKWHFDIGSDIRFSFPEFLSAADLIFTTSVSEGFGLAFLEAWLAGRQLAGRDLPAITADFLRAGMCFPQLYPSLRVPVEWVGKKPLVNSFLESFKQTLKSFGHDVPSNAQLHDELEKTIQDDLVDFSFCNTGFQSQMIERVSNSLDDRQRILGLNPLLAQILTCRNTDRGTIDHNANVVRHEYCLERCGQRLLTIYEQLLDCERKTQTQPLAHADRVLESFLNLSQFHPLRVEQ